MEKIIVPTYHPSEALFRELSPEQKFTRILELLYSLGKDDLPANFEYFTENEIYALIEEQKDFPYFILNHFQSLWAEKNYRQKPNLQLPSNFNTYMDSFEKWNFEQVEQHFGLTRIKQHPSLLEWENLSVEITDNERNYLILLRGFLEDYVDAWQEEDLKMNFISPLLLLINFHTDYSRPFFETKLSNTLISQKDGMVNVGGVVDCLISMGKVKPQSPFFCLQEYKPEAGTSKNPIGQLLISMVVAQSQNEANQIVYGVYVIGRSWYFVTLDQIYYTVSRLYDATREEDIIQIFKMLKGLKEHVILKKINNPA